MTLRWGIIAPGAIARVFASDLAILDPSRECHRITAVGSRELVRAAQFARDFGVEDHFGSYSQVFNSPKVDAVYVANVQSAHYATVMAALDAGKHVLCEKPFTINATEANAIFDLAKSRGIFVMEAMWMRFLPHIIEILDLIDNDAIGEPCFVIADHGQSVHAKPDHRLLDPVRGGGSLLDLGVYPISLAHLIMGTPKSIAASASFTDRGVDREVSIRLGFEEGKSATLHTTIDSVTATRATIAGWKGRIEIDRSFYAPTSFTLFQNDGSEARFENRLHIPGYVGIGEQVNEVARAIQAGEIESPMRPHRATLEVMSILDEIRREIGLRYPGEVSDTDNTGIVS